MDPVGEGGSREPGSDMKNGNASAYVDEGGWAWCENRGWREAGGGVYGNVADLSGESSVEPAAVKLESPATSLPESRILELPYVPGILKLTALRTSAISYVFSGMESSGWT